MICSLNCDKLQTVLLWRNPYDENKINFHRKRIGKSSWTCYPFSDINFLSGSRIATTSGHKKGPKLQGSPSMSYSRKHAHSEPSCPSLLYPRSSSVGPGWEVSPWQQGCAPVPGEQRIGEKEVSGSRNEWEGACGCTVYTETRYTCICNTARQPP